MKFIISTTFLIAAGIFGVQGITLVSEKPLCKYEKLSVKAWYNCNDMNGGSDPYKDSDCLLPCFRAGSQDKFVHVSNNWGGGRCALQCYLKA
ncbi:hypothetical protein EsH8_I_000227 [Colletotrichum jinshuiense]